MSATDHNGHILLGQALEVIDDLYLQHDGEGSYLWSVYYTIGGVKNSMEARGFSSKAGALSDALRHGCAPSADWYQKRYPEHFEPAPIQQAPLPALVKAGLAESKRRV